MRGHRMPEANALELFGAPRVRSSERISVTRYVDRTWQTGPFAPQGAGELGRMLLSFERPAYRRRLRGPRSLGCLRCTASLRTLKTAH